MNSDTSRTTSAVAGTWIMFLRIVAMYRNSPGLFAITLAAPLSMMLLFGFVFGGALAGGVDASVYRSYLTPGVLVLVAAMGLLATAPTANADLRSGLTDRVRALPVHPIAAPAGFVLAETVTGGLALIVMAAADYLAGWRVDASPVDIALAALLLLAFRYALAWLGTWLGTAVRDEQMLQQVAPLVFAAIMFSNVFVPIETMPGAVRTIAEWNPVSAVVAALRQLFGLPATAAADSAWTMRHPVASAFIWIAALLAVSIPTAVRRYAPAR
ncbi:ABC transporter permease [Nocardia araoensis]|uniref:ABC transporter permease n=1 Tax=Nocardia araoensis TaxID=228600 RepID=UPI000308D4D4|nr:ABC transporter permease [Nocardia araoensis]